MFCKTYGAALHGVDAQLITIEVNADKTLDFTLVGLPDTAVKESHHRINSALRLMGYKLPDGIIVNMAPADTKKVGPSYELPIALGILTATEQLKSPELEKYLFMGELSLDGHLQPIKGALPMAIMARQQGFKGFILPMANAEEAAIVDNLEVCGAETLSQVIQHLTGERILDAVEIDTRAEFNAQLMDSMPDFSEVQGQENVKRALEVAVAGGHNIIMIGPPGAGKSMMAKRLPSIMPPMSLHEALETTKIHSIMGLAKGHRGLMSQRPFRSPHHTVSSVAIVGGGSNPMPGEISLAHNGVLFLDELPEYPRSVLEVLRQPLEDRKVSISRAKACVEYPASFMLVAAMNPCPCGYYNHPTHECSCNPGQIVRYLGKVSGPLMDRIDIQVQILPVPIARLQSQKVEEKSEVIRQRVIAARRIQQERYKDEPGVYCNAQMTTSLLRKYAQLDEESTQLLGEAMHRYDLSARAYDRILKLARTIADLAGAESIQKDHVSEAIRYRELDKESWGK